MDMFRKKSPIEKERENLKKKESTFLKKRQEKKETVLNQKLAERIPKTLQHTLDASFAKAFMLIFEKGIGIIEKTYDKEGLEKTFQVNHYADEVRQNRSSLRAFSKKAGAVGTKNLLLSGVSGIGLGTLGIGLPDIPLFTGLVLKNLYEIAISYGYGYESEEEQYYILLLIQGAVSYGNKLMELDKKVNEYTTSLRLPEKYNRECHITETAQSLSKELLYMKFLQGIPVVGMIGGAYDVIYMRQISAYANLKYWRRFLSGREDAEKDDL